MFLLRMRRMFSLRSTLQLRDDGLLVNFRGRQVAGSGKGERDLVNGRSRLPAEFECADLAVRNRRLMEVNRRSAVRFHRRGMRTTQATGIHAINSSKPVRGAST